MATVISSAWPSAAAALAPPTSGRRACSSCSASASCNESFDDINSNLSKFPIAYAVAASSSVPVVLHQVTLRDFSTTFKQYRHLVDGGVVDNLGIATLVETYRAQVEAAQQHGQPDPY